MAALIAAAGTGCSQIKSKSIPIKKVTVVLDWTPNTNHTGLYVAKDKGYFKAEGLDVDIEQPPEDGALSLLAAGKAQFAISSQDELASAFTSDSPLDVSAVAALIQHNTSGIISLKDKGIASPKDMQGRKYATWDSPVEKAVLKNVVTRDGGDFSKVQLIPETVDNVVATLKTNKIDCVWIFYAWDGIACQVKGVPTNYFAFKDINPALDFYTPVIAAGNSFLKNDPETAKKFLAAAEKGYKYAVSNPDDAAGILCKYAPETDRTLAVKSQEYLKTQYMAEVKRWGYIDRKRWDGFYSWMNDNGLLAKKLPKNGGFTDVYLPED